MAQRAGETGGTVKKPPRKAAKPRGKAKTARKSPRSKPSSPCIDELREQLELRTRERDEARKHLAESLEQQTATSEVPGVISSSPGNLEDVFDALLENVGKAADCDPHVGQRSFERFRELNTLLRVLSPHV